MEAYVVEQDVQIATEPQWSSYGAPVGDQMVAGEEPRRARNASEKLHNLFVGDLDSTVDTETLIFAFSSFPTVYDAKVVMDPRTGRSRGYGFVSFRDKADAEAALNAMNGAVIGRRAVRVSWGNRTGPQQFGRPSPPRFIAEPAEPSTVAEVSVQSASNNSTVYVGNIPHTATDTELAFMFQPYGYVLDVRIQMDRGFAFVSMDSHESAALAIANLNGTQMIPGGKRIKCGWGKERPDRPDIAQRLQLTIPQVTYVPPYPTPVATPAFFPPEAWMVPVTAPLSPEDALAGTTVSDAKEGGISVTYPIYNPYVYAFPVAGVPVPGV